MRSATDGFGRELYRLSRRATGEEARIFELTPASVWADLRRVKVPMLFIRGASSDTFLPGAAAKAERALDHATVIAIDETSHFLPMERPAAVAAVISDWWQGLEQDA